MVDIEEQKRRQEVERADQAQALVKNPILAKLYDEIEKEVLSALELTHDEKAITKLHLMFVLNRKHQNILKSYIETGKLAAMQLEEKRKFKLWSSN